MLLVGQSTAIGALASARMGWFGLLCCMVLPLVLGCAKQAAPRYQPRQDIDPKSVLLYTEPAVAEEALAAEDLDASPYSSPTEDEPTQSSGDEPIASGDELSGGDSEAIPDDIAALLGGSPDSEGKAPGETAASGGFPGTNTATFAVETRFSLPVESEREVFFEQQLAWRQKVAPDDHWSLLLELEAAFSTQGSFSGDELFDERSPERPNLTFRELFLSGRFDSFEAHLGQLLVSWGKSDAFRPLNVVNPVDYTHFTDTRAIPVPAAQATFYSGAVQFNVVYVPLFLPARLPPAGTQYDLSPQGAPPINRVMPDTALDQGQFMARLALFSEIDASLVYGFQLDQGGRLTAGLESGAPVLNRTFERIHQTGLAVSLPLGPIEVHAESAARFYPAAETLEWSVRTIAGLNYFGHHLFWEDNEVDLIVEYTRSDAEQGVPGDVFFERSLESALIQRLVFAFNTSLAAELQWLLDVPDTEYALGQLELTYDFGDLGELAAGYELLMAGSESRFAPLDPRDRVFFEYLASF